MYAGLDLHKMYTQYAIMDKDGVLVKEGRIENDPDELERFSDSMDASTEIVIESSSTWYGVYKILAKRHHVVLSNPGKTKAIASAKVKTDKIDSITLANLLRGGYLDKHPKLRSWLYKTGIVGGRKSGAGSTARRRNWRG